MLVIGYLLPSVWLYFRECRLRWQYLAHVGCCPEPEGHSVPARVCDALLLLVPLAAILSSLTLSSIPGTCQAGKLSASPST